MIFDSYSYVTIPNAKIKSANFHEESIKTGCIFTSIEKDSVAYISFDFAVSWDVHSRGIIQSDTNTVTQKGAAASQWPYRIVYRFFCSLLLSGNLRGTVRSA